MDAEKQTRFLFAGFGGKLGMLNSRLNHENSRPFTNREPETGAGLGAEGEIAEGPFPRGYISTTTYEWFFEDAEASEKTEWKPPVQRWLESRAQQKECLVPKWMREEEEVEDGGEELSSIRREGKRMHKPKIKMSLGRNGNLSKNTGNMGRMHLVGRKR